MEESRPGVQESLLYSGARRHREVSTLDAPGCSGGGASRQEPVDGAAQGCAFHPSQKNVLQNTFHSRNFK